MDLKWLLVRRITVAALACLAAAVGVAAYQATSDARINNVELLDLIDRQLDRQLGRIDRSLDVTRRFPDWQIVSTYELRPGQCVEFFDTSGRLQHSRCAGVDATRAAPEWFAKAYGFLLDADMRITRDIVYRDTPQGALVTSYGSAATATRVWENATPLALLCVVTIAVLSLVTTVVVDRALRPAKDILSGLNRLAEGDLSCRLPACRLSELNRISEVFNTLSHSLQTATTERTELARRLVDTQEQERRHIARELHDDIAQKLAALSAVAACLRAGSVGAPDSLRSEAQELEQMSSGLMQSLRRTLNYLRPQEIDDLGLLESLRALIERQNESARGSTTYSIETGGNVEHLGAETSAHVYRIVQEALTNAAKHANARNVRVRLTELAEAGKRLTRLLVTDDGDGDTRAVSGGTPSTGSGMIGMRERVLALNGTFRAGALPQGGFGLEVEFPT